MTYIKINKSSLDYHQFSDFHVFTMNNLVRNVMQKGKYKKAVRIVRLGLLKGLKELQYMLKTNKSYKIVRSFKYLPRTTYKNRKKTKIELKLKKNIKQKKKKIKSLTDEITDYYEDLNNTISLTIKRPKPTFSFSKLFNVILEKHKKNENDNIAINSEEPKKLTNKYTNQYTLMQSLQFKKIYSKKPHVYYYGMRNLTVFDMVIQVYTLLTGAWYMRKAKVSGRTILIPSPLRPYRRVTTVTKMLLKGIRKRRKQDRYMKNAMITAIGTEFYWLLLYNGVLYTRNANMIDNSFVWLAKTDSHKELVANLKNIKHLKYF